jgi:LysM repeat protein
MRGSSRRLALVVPLVLLAVLPAMAIAEGMTYVVKPGDYLVAIGLKVHLPWQSIAAENHLASPYTIYPGQTLKLPSANCPHEEDSNSYTVRSGDYLTLIGHKLGVDWKEIAEANCLQAPYVIYPGQVLAIPSEDSEDQSD